MKTTYSDHIIFIKWGKEKELGERDVIEVEMDEQKPKELDHKKEVRKKWMEKGGEAEKRSVNVFQTAGQYLS